MPDTAIQTDDLFVNADAGFDCTDFRDCCPEKGIVANILENPRNDRQRGSELYFDDELYRWRKAAEHAFAWMDSCKALLIRFETLHQTWRSMNILGIICLFLRRIAKRANKLKKL